MGLSPEDTNLEEVGELLEEMLCRVRKDYMFLRRRSASDDPQNVPRVRVDMHLVLEFHWHFCVLNLLGSATLSQAYKKEAEFADA